MSSEPNEREPNERERIREQVAEKLARMERVANTPRQVARVAAVKQRLARMSDMDAERDPAKDLLPCPECRRWSDLADLCCPHCGKVVELAAIEVRSGVWRLHAVLAPFFTTVGLAFGWVCLPSHYVILVKVLSGLAAAVAFVLALPSWLELGRIAFWLRRKRGRVT